MKKNFAKPDVREQTLKHGLLFPTDEELIMMILGTGTKEYPVEYLSRIIINTLNSSNEENFVQNLIKIKGMGPGKALAIASAIELGRRRNRHKEALIKKPKDIIPFIQGYSMNQKEHFLCVTLNGGNEIIQIRVISVGTVNKTIVHPREIFSEALKENAAAIVVCHNHPSGNCRPSEEDIETTKTIKASADILGITILDHIIFSKNSYFSFLENDLLFTD
ncbi:MAG: DNA repair protein RadC [Treponema sp.]|nr:DNA repair protein RadC [Treponema sp.]